MTGHPLVGRTMKVRYGVNYRVHFANHQIVDVTVGDTDYAEDLTLWFEEGSGTYGIDYGPGIDILPADSPDLAHPLNTDYPERTPS